MTIRLFPSHLKTNSFYYKVRLISIASNQKKKKFNNYHEERRELNTIRIFR